MIKALPVKENSYLCMINPIIPLKMRKEGILTIFLCSTFGIGNAQHFNNHNDASLYAEEATRLNTEEYYYGSQNLINGNDDATELMNAYFLNTPGTIERISRWQKDNPVHPDRVRLQMMAANLLTKDQEFDEALEIYNSVYTDELNNIPAKEQIEAKLYHAIALIQTGQMDWAERLLNEIRDSETHQHDIYYYTGYVHYNKGEYDQALNYFMSVKDSKEYHNQAPVYISDCYLQTGKPDLALSNIKTWQQVCSDSRLSNEARRIEGEAYYELGNYPNAVSSLSGYMDNTEEPTRSSLYKLGMSQFYCQDYANAARMLSKSAGTASDAMAQNAWLHAGKSYVSAGNQRQAGMAFQQAARMDADTQVQEEAFYNYALTLHSGGNMGFGESVSAFEEFLNKYPRSKYATSVSQHLTEVYFTTKNYPAALASINKIKNPSKEIISAKQKVLYNLGTASFASGDYRKAKQYMAQSNATQQNYEAIFWKGESEYRLGEFSDAASDYATYLKHGTNRGNRALAYYGQGYLAFNNKRYASALNNFNNYISEANKIGGYDQTSLKSDAYNRIGDCLFTQRKYDEAYNSYNNSFNTDKAHGDYSLLQMSVISGLKGDYTKKVGLLNQLDNLYSKSSYADQALYEKGRAYVLSSDYPSALNTFNTLIQKAPKSTYARRSLNEIGMIYMQMGQTDKAVAQYESIIDKYPNTEESASALESLKQIYNSQGKVNEYAALARRAGVTLSPQELDEMTENAAIIALADSNYVKAYEHYIQLQYQTLSEDVRVRALEGAFECAEKNGDAEACSKIADIILGGNSKVAPEKQMQARLIRAKRNMAAGNPQAAVGDYLVLATDSMTVYGAQGTVELAQYCYDTKQYEQAEQILDRFIDSGTMHTYWLARAFVLISDVYAETDRKIEAREYLLSLKANYNENEEINKMIEERLSRL